MQDQTIKTAVRSTKAAEDAILSEVGRNENKLIVMGVARPAGEPLFFGEIARGGVRKIAGLDIAGRRAERRETRVQSLQIELIAARQFAGA